MRWTLASGGTGQARWVNLDYAVASKAIARFEQRMRTDPRLCEQLAGVQQQLSNRQMTILLKKFRPLFRGRLLQSGPIVASGRAVSRGRNALPEQSVGANAFGGGGSV